MFLGNYDDNNKDAKMKGRSNAPKGVEHKKAKLTQKQAELAKFLRARGWKYVVLEKIFGLHANNISRICKGKAYIPRGA